LFWGNNELKVRLPALITPYDSELLDRATYKLRIGNEVYVSPTGVGEDTDLKTKRQLKAGDDFQVPPGQFALLVTQEQVTVPEEAIAFISMRARYKFQGLVNVSGFHVDPGFTGRLIFSVFNAGPSSVHLECGEPCFHIWYADLRDYGPQGPKAGYDHIPAQLVKHIADGMQSFAGLDSKIDDLEKRLSERIYGVDRKRSAILTSLQLVTTLLVGIGVALFIKFWPFESAAQQTPPAGPPEVSSQPLSPSSLPPTSVLPSTPSQPSTP